MDSSLQKVTRIESKLMHALWSVSDGFTEVILIVLQLCGYEPDIEPPMVYGENDTAINISSNSN